MSDLYPYQEEGVTFLTSRRRALLADEPGLGKTVQTIRAAQKAGMHRILVICPKTAVPNWFAEFEKWWPSFKGELHVVNYDKFSKKNIDWDTDKKDLLVLDEAHRLKSAGANRTKNIYRHVVPHFEHVWLLTGTPTPNHNGELFTHLRALVPDYITHPQHDRPMNQSEFEDRFCRVDNHPQWGRRINGNKNTPELRQIIAPFVLRRKKQDVLTDLPALTFTEQHLAMSVTDLNESDLSRHATPGMLDDEILAALRSQEMSLSEERRLTGIAKTPAAGELIRDMLADGTEKLIVFAHHRDVMDAIEKELNGTPLVRIDGQVSMQDRAKAVARFQQDPACRVFIGQIAACGEAITLTAASDVLFVEASWTPSENYQAACRAHRIGQQDAVTARFLSVPGSLDDLIAKTLARKAREIAELFG